MLMYKFRKFFANAAHIYKVQFRLAFRMWALDWNHCFVFMDSDRINLERSSQ